jgi:tetratricopeptide (TPR) repeat protein
MRGVLLMAAATVLTGAGLLTGETACDSSAIYTRLEQATGLVRSARPEAARIAQEAAKQLRACSPLVSLEGVRVYNLLAEVNRHVGRGKDAEAWAHRAAETAATAVGPDSVERAVCLETLALSLSSRKRYLDAEPYLSEAMRIARSHNGEQSLFYASLLNSLAALHFGLEDTDGARRHLERAAAITRNHPEQPLHAVVQRNLQSLSPDAGQRRGPVSSLR